MKKRVISVLTTLVLAMSLLGIIPASAASVYSVTVKSQEKYGYAYEVLDIINKERSSRGLSKLTMDKAMLDAAMQRAAEISISFSHDRPDGSDCFSAFDWDYCVGENIAWGYSSPSSVCSGWMNSQGHRENILTSGFESVGIGCAYIDGSYCWVQVFDGGAPVSVSKPADKTVTRSVKISEDFKADYLPSTTPVITSVSSALPSVTIKWGAVSKANGYRIYKYNERTKSYKSLATVSSSTLSYIDKTAVPGETARYKVKAYRKVGAVTGWSPASAAKSAAVTPAKVTLGSASSSTTAVRLNWSRVNCTGYKIYRFDTKTGSYKLAAKVGAGNTTCRMSGLKSKTAYKFKMRAYVITSDGRYIYGPYSAVKTVTTK